MRKEREFRTVGALSLFALVFGAQDRAAQASDSAEKSRPGTEVASVADPAHREAAGQGAGFEGKGAAAVDGPPAGVAVQVLPTGHRRTMPTITVPITAERLAEMSAAGKTVELDPETGEQTVTMIRDYLPANWGADVATGAWVDSYGDPIVNGADGLPDWAQKDVDALRQAIAEALVHRQNLRWALRGQASRIERVPANVVASAYARTAKDMSDNLYETERVLGNYLGQAVVRGIDVSDEVDLLQSDAVTEDVAGAVLDYLHFYENLKFLHAEDGGYVYQPSQYDHGVAAFVAEHGGSLERVLAIEAPPPTAQATPSGCYTNSVFARGMTILAGATVIWSANGLDDGFADVPIGFKQYAYTCDDPDVNTSVRVSSNGYLTYFQQGGGALDGNDFSNDTITVAVAPDGYVAPFWDDLVVHASQGNTDMVSYKTEGSAGSRVFTVEWFSISRRAGDSDDWHFFQVKFFENSNDVELHISTDWNADTLDTATVGMEDFAGSDGDCGPNCGTANTSPPNNYRFATIRPANNVCASATCIDLDEVVRGTTFGATGANESSCASASDADDVWYEFVAEDTGNHTFSLCGSSFDTSLSVFAAPCVGAELACDDDLCIGLQSQLTVALTIGTTYLVRVAGYQMDRGDFVLVVTGPFAGLNGDVCSDCWTVDSGFNPGYLTTNNSGCTDETSCAFGDIVDEWFCWMATCAGVATADTDHATTNFDTTLAVFDDCAGTELDCDDDGGTGGTSLIQWPAAMGHTYRLRVSGFFFAVGNYALTISCVPCVGNAQCDDSSLCTLDECNAGACSSTALLFADVNNDGFVNVSDTLCELDTVGGNPNSASCFEGGGGPPVSAEQKDIAPCPALGDPGNMGDGFINTDDVLATLDAFAGNPLAATAGCAAACTSPAP